MVFFVRHVLHLTSQHQWKVHAQRSTTVTSCVRYPRPQHIRSQPSTPIDVSLHWRPWVPRIPSRRFFSQNPGDCSKYTRSLGVGGLWSGLYGFSENLYLFDEKFLLEKPENHQFFKFLPILFLVILPISMHWVCFPHVVWVWRDVFVPPVASCDLIFGVVPKTVADLHAWCTIKTVFKCVANDSKIWQSHPAGFDRTRSWHSMAFTLFAHLRLNVL